MNEKQAAQIAKLLNTRNKLVKPYTGSEILEVRDRYLFEVSAAGDVTGCVELKRVQWYQFEIDHLSVIEDVERKGVAWALFKRAEEKAKQAHGRILQCTIREGNADSQKFFRRNGFSKVSEFFYPNSGNNVGVWQKVISAPKAST